jgi:predicted nucleic acid-binding protein
MNGIDLIADTNALIYLLAGRKEVDVLNGYSIGISVISELEMVSRPNTTDEELSIIRSLIYSCTVIGIKEGIKEEFRRISQNYSLKLPDAIIAATALHFGLPLVTADKRFSVIDELNLIQIYRE